MVVLIFSLSVILFLIWLLERPVAASDDAENEEEIQSQSNPQVNLEYINEDVSRSTHTPVPTYSNGPVSYYSGFSGVSGYGLSGISGTNGARGVRGYRLFDDKVISGYDGMFINKCDANRLISESGWTGQSGIGGDAGNSRYVTNNIVSYRVLNDATGFSGCIGFNPWRNTRTL